MSPVAKYMTPAVAKKISALVKAGATIIVNDAPEKSYSLEQGVAADKQVKTVAASIWKKLPAGSKWKVGAGTVVQGPYKESSFESLGIKKDLIALEASGKQAKDIAWTHRRGNGFDIYFISNQRNEGREMILSLRSTGLRPEIWDPVTGHQKEVERFGYSKGATYMQLLLPANGSVFIVLRKQAPEAMTIKSMFEPPMNVDSIKNPWTVTFDPKKGGPAEPVVFEQLKDWSTDNNTAIKYYSGTAVYTTTVSFDKPATDYKVWFDAGNVANIAEVYVNGQNCGVIWTAPYRVDITKALRPGKNELKIEVTNTWFNRMKGDLLLPEKERITQTNAPFWGKDKPLLPAGLLGPVTIVTEQ